MAHDVFISFSFKDQKLVDRITNHLNNIYNIPCWICTEDIRGGEYYYDKIADAITISKVLVFVQTKNSVESTEIPDEVLTAIDEGKTIISFIVEDSELHGQMKLKLKHRQHVDGRQDPLDDRIRDLAKEICKVLGKPFGETEENKPKPSYHLQSSKVTCSEIFYGRDDVLQQIHTAFEERNVVFLYGMGGIGKSEIARQYVKRYSNEYATVVFARYTDSLVKLVADDTVFCIDGITRQIKETQEVQTDVEYADEKLKILRTECGTDTLIIIDNYDVEYDPYLEELEKDGKYRLLITTRYDPKDSRYIVFPVTEIKDDEALKDIVISHCREEYVTINRNDPAFAELFALTMRHTLALELIAQYMEETSLELADMVDMLHQQGLQPLGEVSIIRMNSSYNPYEVIKRLFSLSALTESEKQFIRLLCLMPVDGIERNYFKKWCDRKIFSSQTHLLKRSMIKYDGESSKIFMHPLIREVATAELIPCYAECNDFLDSFANDLLDYIAWNYPITKKNMYFECCKNIQRFVPEITAETFPLWFHMTNFGCFVDTFDNNIEHLQCLLQKAKAIFGNDSAWVGKLLHRLGWCYYAYGDYEKALRILETKAFPVLEQVIYKAPGEYIHCCCDIAKLYFQKNSIDNAEYYLKKAENITEDEKLLTDTEIVQYRAIMIYSVRMLFASEQVDYDQALLHSKKSLDRAKLLEHTELDQAAILSSLGKVWMKKGDYGQAICHFQTAINIMEEYSGMLNTSCSHGDRHCRLYILLTECFEKTDNIASAKNSIAEAYTIAEKIYRSGHLVHSEVREMYKRLHG